MFLSRHKQDTLCWIVGENPRGFPTLQYPILSTEILYPVLDLMVFPMLTADVNMIRCFESQRVPEVFYGGRLLLLQHATTYIWVCLQPTIS